MADRDDVLGTFGRAAAVTLHDTNELSPFAKRLYVGGTGNLKVTTPAGDTVTFSGVPAGTTLPIKAKVVFATGSTATNVIALY